MSRTDTAARITRATRFAWRHSVCRAAGHLGAHSHDRQRAALRPAERQGRVATGRVWHSGRITGERYTGQPGTAVPGLLHRQRSGNSVGHSHRAEPPGVVFADACPDIPSVDRRDRLGSACGPVARDWPGRRVVRHRQPDLLQLYLQHGEWHSRHSNSAASCDPLPRGAMACRS